MVKTKEKAGSSSSSSKGKGKQVEQQPRKRQYIGRISESESGSEEEMELDPHDKPVWNSGPLDDQAKEWQPTLYHDSMNKLKNKAAAFICERDVREVEFQQFGVFDKFRALGWESALKCFDKDKSNLFMTEIQEWMATLKCHHFNKPSQMKLIGEVHGVPVEMSFDTLKKLGKYDSLPARDYMVPTLDDLLLKPEKHVRWNDMLAAIFLPGTYSGILYRKNLKIEAKLLLAICVLNVIPCRGDKEQVRYPEVPVLYSLMHGSPRFPIRYLIMHHLWICRNKYGRDIVPYCRIITGLMKQQKALTSEDRGVTKRHQPFTLDKMGSGWTYTQLERYHKLKSEGQRWIALKANARDLLPGEEDEPESEAEIPSGDEDYEEQPQGGVNLNVGQGGHGRGYGGMFYDYAQQSYEPGWAYNGTMQEVIESQRPPASIFDTWSGSERTLYDQNTRNSASIERSLKHSFDRQESWNRTLVYSREVETNNRYFDDQARRMHADWHAGRPVVEDPQHVDYASLPPYDGSVSYPTPPLHHSQWIDPRQQEGAQQQGGSSSGAFGFGEWNDMMSSIFGPPGPRYY
ncbi:hypothetical protein HanRHA438_Chr15g0732351 [Helianthus annuus]|uniref:uncharacterized protein LOC110910692 n=1 Tax=Helianthus annuus TaxID=4232 RepID=UPI000B903818|nr:uncharacterized protein LOC110910692 [Helianthus annuus]KAJ0847101.1 hypothetical protein HanRHA438_Chr15g0732351 [Helianthus annuus]